MTETTELLFDPWRLDLANECIWRGTQALKLTPKAFAVLHYLAEHPSRVVSKAELLEAVWAETYVSEGVLTTCMREIRRALGEEAKAPRYIETVHRRGYRFIAPLSTTPPVVNQQKPAASPQLAPGNWQLATQLVGREPELTQLQHCLTKALNGERQLIFVTGEVGIGKTSVVDAFVAQVCKTSALWWGHGQCIEQFGAGEAYLPILSALGQLGREPGHERLVEILSQYAPTWLIQMPALLSPTEFEALQRKTAGATRERMLREMAEALEALTADRLLVLVLEDLHWSDPSTLEFLSFLARRRQAAELLVLGTYRPIDVLADGHPLRAVTQELQLHRHCEELALGLLTEGDVAQYLAVRLAAPAPAQGEDRGEDLPPLPLHSLTRLLHRRTEGNPLFMATVVDALLSQGLLREGQAGEPGQGIMLRPLTDVQAGVPATLEQMIERQFDRLSPEDQRVLEVASVAGMEFSAAAVAAGAGAEVAVVEARCASLARRGQFLWASGVAEWPDGTIAAHYSFRHALYQEVIYGRVTAGQRQRLHQRIGEREERAYGDRAREIAAELALHFERGREYRKAVRYLRQAGENAVQRSAHQEAITLLTKGLELLKLLPDTSERAQQELTLQISLGASLIITRGHAAPEVERAYTRARELCRQAAETPQLSYVLHGLRVFYFMRAELHTARELAEQCLSLAQRLHDPRFLPAAHLALGEPLFFLGELAAARAHFEQATAHSDPQLPRTSSIFVDSGAAGLAEYALLLWQLGYPAQARQRSHEALTRAQALSHPFSLAHVLGVTAQFHQLCREGRTAQKQSEALIVLSGEQGFPFWSARGTLFRGWALAEEGQGEGLVEVRQGLAALQATGTELDRPYYLGLLAEACGNVGQAEEGVTTLAEALALVQKTGERRWEAELYRLKGTLTLQSKVPSRKSQVEKEAEECFWKAVEIARRQQAKSLELRATVSLSRLWQRQGKKNEARQMLAEIYNWFTEGFDTADLQEAKTLLEELSH
ncbi:MAG TPA: AAA family ATPase [Candidatus Binatia bacterium]|nr:AAA family ATPase [Candidatus Binatia bacterium]